LRPVRQADRGEQPGDVFPGEREELRALRREVAKLRRANAILKDATGYFAAELYPTRQDDRAYRVTPQLLWV
jgi:transposase-like protein